MSNIHWLYSSMTAYDRNLICQTSEEQDVLAPLFRCLPFWHCCYYI